MSLPVCLVFGATGTTGKHFVSLALDAGELNLHLFVRTPSKLSEEVGSNSRVELVQGDITDMDAIGSAVVGAKYVGSMAGDKTKLSADGITEKFTKNVIEFFSGSRCRKFCL